MQSSLPSIPNLVHVGSVALNQTPLDWRGNKARIIRACQEARDSGLQVLCLPELVICGYGCEDGFFSPSLPTIAWEQLQEILPYTQNLFVGIGLPIYYSGRLINAVAACANGEILGFVGKQNLPKEGLHYEPRWFTPWPAGELGNWESPDGNHFPIGDLVFEVNGLRIGFEICEDAWVSNRPGTSLADRSVDLILNPSASHFALNKHKTRVRSVLEASRAYTCAYIYANFIGNEAGRSIYDGGTIIASGGKLLARSARFQYSPVQCLTATIDIFSLRAERVRKGLPLTKVSKQGLVKVPRFNWSQKSLEVTTLNTPPQPEAWELTPYSSFEEMTRACALGLFDYARKAKASGFVLSISGGADSACVACLVSCMLSWATQSMGNEYVQQQFGIPHRSQPLTLEDILTCVYQGTQNSSDTTFEAAKELTEFLKAKFFSWNVDELVADYTEKVETVLSRKLSWEQDDKTLQNIQARVRGPGVWMLANTLNALLLTTSNRSEAAVGYATMDGDTCGGLAPIAGMDKTTIRSMLIWLEQEGPLGLGPITGLKLVNAQQPTAELRPQGSAQKDEEDLMPYDVLDTIQSYAIKQKYTPAMIIEVLTYQYPDSSQLEIQGWVKRFFQLWCQNQWKRERYAPGFHLDEASLDPKTWCRFPILNGGYRFELEEL